MPDRLRSSWTVKAVLTVAVVFSATVFHAQIAQAQAADPVVLTFSTVGDSRQDPGAPDSTTTPLSNQDKIWLQNTKAWSRILRTIQAQKPSMLIFNGDMIHGYGWNGFGYTSNLSGSTIAGPTAPTSVADIVGSDLVKAYQQYGFWRGMVAPVMEAGTYIIPVAGNHETECKACGKIAKVENEAAWGTNMGDLILDNSRLVSMFGAQAPTNASFNAGGTTGTPDADGLTTNQSKLSYSFDFKGSHFTVINTDPVGKDATAPTAWLAADLAAAQGRGNTHFFVFGHKPAYTYAYLSGSATGAAGLDKSPGTVTLRDAFWNVIEQYGATYFCGHEHIFNMMQPRLNDPTPGSAYQVLVGSGGSPFDAKATDTTISPATDRSYAWATVSVHQSGKVDINAFGFSNTYGPTQLLQSVSLSH